MEFGTASVVLARVTEGWPADDVTDLLARLSLLYDTLHPPRSE